MNINKVNKLVKENVVGSRVQVSVETGVHWLIKCKYEINKNYIQPTHINPESISWFVKTENNTYVFVYFHPKSVYNTPEPVCNIVITEPFVKNEIGGINTKYDSLSFLDELLSNVYMNTGVKLNYDCFGKLVK